MLCQNCNKNDATVHYTKIINGNVDKLHLCDECALNIHEFDTSFSLHNLLTGLIDNTQTESIDKKEDDIKCSFCGLKYNEFKESGRFGCTNCYNAFKARLTPLLKGIHGHDTHIGKVPSGANNNIVREREIDKLRKELDILVNREAFEEAAILRDKIKELEEEM